MRFALTLLFLLALVCSPGAIAQTHVQQCKPFSDTSGTGFQSVSCGFPSPTSTGTSIVLGIGFGTANPTITAKDDAGGTYAVACRVWDSNHRQGLAVMRTKSTAAPATRITVNFSSSVQYVSLAAHEVSGLAADEPNGCKGLLGSGGLPAGGKVTLTMNDYVFSAALEDGSGSGATLTPGSGFILRTDLDTAASYGDADGLFSGSAQGTWTLSPSSSWLAITYAIQPAGAVVPVTVKGQFVYDDGTPFRGTAVLFIEGTVESQAGSAVLDQNGVATLTFTADPAKTYHAVLLDSSAAPAFEMWSISLGSAIAQQELAALSGGMVKVTIAKTTGKIVSVTKQ